MELLIFSVFDSAAGAYLQPFFAPTVESAIRSFRQSINSDGPFSQFPEDFTLFSIGKFDGATGQVAGFEPHSLGVALTFVQSPMLPPGGGPPDA